MVCETKTRECCDYYKDFVRAKLSQGRMDFWDAVALALTYIVLWINSESSLFPSGLVMYAIACLIGLLKFSDRSFLKRSMKVAYAVIAWFILVVGVFGLFGAVTCKIIGNLSYVCFNSKITSVIVIPPIRTFHILAFSGIPTAANIIRYIVGYCTSKPNESAVAVAP